MTDEELRALERYVDGDFDDDRCADMVKADEIRWDSGGESSEMKERRIRLAREREEATLRRVKERAARLTRGRKGVVNDAGNR